MDGLTNRSQAIVGYCRLIAAINLDALVDAALRIGLVARAA
jgi:hypothetical protein